MWAFVALAAAMALWKPLAVDGAPTTMPATLVENEILRESAAWAGVGTEGLFNAVDSFGIPPSGTFVNMTATLGGAIIENGGVYLYGEVDQSSLQVRVHGQAQSTSSYYTLVLLDPDSLSASNPQAGSNVHGVWANVRNGDVCNATNANVLSFTEVAPTFGSHRVVLLLFHQSRGLVDGDAGDVLRQRMGYPANYTAAQPLNRAQFVLKRLTSWADHPLALVNGAFYYVPCSAASAAANPYLGATFIADGLAACTPYCSGDCSAVVVAAEGNFTALVACPCDAVATGVHFSSPAAAKQASGFGARAQWAGYGDSGTKAAMDAVGLFEDGALEQVPSQVWLPKLLFFYKKNERARTSQIQI
jgi:hypothetical protein